MSVFWHVRRMPIPGNLPVFPALHDILVLTFVDPGQQLSYDTQLDLKRNVIIKAYKHFSGEACRFIRLRIQTK